MIENQTNTTRRIQNIRAVIQSEESRLRATYPLLAHQDFLGMTIFLGCLSVMAMVVFAYFDRRIEWWLAIPLMALPISILHEIEHDLIHNQYFRNQTWVQHLMFFTIWFSKLSLNPWYRRQIHLKHHVVSGQEADIEERLIGLGLPFGLLRLLVTLHPMGGLLLFPRIKREVPEFKPWKLVLLSVPAYTAFNVIWESYFGYLRVQYGLACQFDPALLLPAWGWPWARDLAVLFALPNMLRQSCLVFLSSHSHYYGDIPKRDIFFQNQILNSWLFMPMQLFCFNFGATHIIHHYVVSQPFYLRQLVAGAALAEMQRQGARTNDLGTFARANRWNSEDDSHFLLQAEPHKPQKIKSAG